MCTKYVYEKASDSPKEDEVFCIAKATQLRWLNRKSAELGAQTVVIGNREWGWRA